MKETEVKFEVKSLKPVAEKLKAMGGSLVWKGSEESWFFDTPKQTLRRAGKMVRLRDWQGHSKTLTLKTAPEKISTKYKVRNEYEVKIENLGIMERILKELGLVEAFKYKKYREHWALPGASVELDKIAGRYFVEIEAPEKTINDLASRLGLSWDTATTQSYFFIINSARGNGKRRT